MKIFKSNDTTSINKLLSSNQFEYTDVNKVVKGIIADVKQRKDEAVLEYTKKFDNASLDSLKVTEQEITEAYDQIDTELLSDLQKAYQNITTYHEKQLPKEYTIDSNGRVGSIIRPVQTAGIYVPGGTAPYPSTVLMNAGPAKVAGVKRIVMVTPPNPDGSISPILLAAAKVAGVTEIYKAGGAQSIAALAFGTETIPKVDTIVGPGNIYVATAKKEVIGYVGIDMIAGPSEVLIIADENANPTFIAADMLAQAEHDKLARTFLLTTSDELANLVQIEVEIQLNTLSRRSIASESIENNGYIIITESLEEAFELSNLIAPEHLELQIKNPDDYIPLVINAGAVFVGEYSPEPLGDYFAGPNHTLPTSGTAKFSSALSTTDFLKSISYISYSKSNLQNVKDSIVRIAEAEGLTAHANAVKVRF